MLPWKWTSMKGDIFPLWKPSGRLYHGATDGSSLPRLSLRLLPQVKSLTYTCPVRISHLLFTPFLFQEITFCYFNWNNMIVPFPGEAKQQHKTLAYKRKRKGVFSLLPFWNSTFLSFMLSMALGHSLFLPYTNDISHMQRSAACYSKNTCFQNTIIHKSSWWLSTSVQIFVILLHSNE